MTQPFLGQIQPFGFGFAPRQWAQCNGQTLSIQQNAALFSLLGTMYGGNGTSTFQLPNLQSRVPMHFGPSPGGETYFQGEIAGEENVTITISTMPGHNHNFVGSSQNAADARPSNGVALATVYQGSTAPTPLYGTPSPPQPLNPNSLATVGGNQYHTNIQPYQAINWCIAMFGIFPSRS